MRRRPALPKAAAPGRLHRLCDLDFGVRAPTRIAPYCAVKAAATQFTRSLAARLGAGGIRPNAVASGSIEFPDRTGQRRRGDGVAAWTTLALAGGDALALPEIGVVLPVAEIYDSVALAGA